MTQSKDTTGCWAVLPVKPFDWAKSRLESALTQEERASMARRLMLGSLKALTESACFERVAVVSRDAEAREIARDHGADVVEESGPPELNQALRHARTIALNEKARLLLVLASDLPLVTSEAVRSVVDAASTARAVIVPDRRSEGTNALLLRPPNVIDFAFGEGSFEKHLALTARAGADTTVMRVKAIAFDVDLPEDLDDLRAMGWPAQQPVS